MRSHKLYYFRKNNRLLNTFSFALFLAARRYASAGISRHRVCVCLSAKRRITQTTQRDCPGTLVF